MKKIYCRKEVSAIYFIVDTEKETSGFYHCSEVDAAEAAALREMQKYGNTESSVEIEEVDPKEILENPFGLEGDWQPESMPYNAEGDKDLETYAREILQEKFLKESAAFLKAAEAVGKFADDAFVKKVKSLIEDSFKKK